MPSVGKTVWFEIRTTETRASLLYPAEILRLNGDCPARGDSTRT
jgi:hypothetical protein